MTQFSSPVHRMAAQTHMQNQHRASSTQQMNNTQGRTQAEKQFVRLPSCLKGCNLEVTVYILIQCLLTWNSQNLREKTSSCTFFFDIHAICIHKIDGWDNTENNMHDLNTSCYSLCSPCLVRKKKRGGRERKKNNLASFCSVLFAGD